MPADGRWDLTRCL